MSTSILTNTVITDSDGQVWANGAWSATLITVSGGVATVNRVPVSDTILTGYMDSTGKIVATLTDTSTIDQVGTEWQFVLTPNASTRSSVVSTAVTGATPNLSTVLSAGVKAPRFAASETAYGYNDAEVMNPILGSVYLNTIDNNFHFFDQSGWGGSEYTTVQLTPVTPPTSAATAGTIGQLVAGTDGNLYFCSATGVATAATWNVLTMTAV